MWNNFVAFMAALSLFVSQYNHPLHFVKGQMIGADKLEMIVMQATNAKCKGGGPLDQMYFAPDPSEITKIVAQVKNDLTYEEEVYDCDDFSYWFKASLEKEWRKAGHTLPLPIVQIFSVLEVKATGKRLYHAFNGIVDSTGHIVWVEPQGPQVVNFSRINFIMAIALWI